jgi:mercuric ion transport protein
MKEKLFTTGALISAGLASICCLGPPLLAVLGLGGIGLAAGFARYRPLFLSLTAILLGIGFYITYRKREVACSDGACELRSGSRRMKVALWTLTLVVVALATFPHYATLFGHREGLNASPGAERLPLSIVGMTCSACAVSIENALEKVPGVRAASVEKVLEAVRTAGPYTAEVKR